MEKDVNLPEYKINLEKIKDDYKLYSECDLLHKYFWEQISLIKSTMFQQLVIDFIDHEIPRFEFEKPTSSTGKYHPTYQNGFLGNARHTKNVVKVLQVFERAHPDMMWDSMYAAAILHDSTKYENESSFYTDSKHALTSAEHFKSFSKRWIKNLKKSRIVKTNFGLLRKYSKMTYKCIKWHDGRFNPLNATKDQIKENFTKKFYRNVRDAECHLVHLADMISASRSLSEDVF